MAKIIDRTKPRQVTGLKVKGTATEKLTNLSWAAGIDNVGVVQYEIRISGSKKVYKSKKTNLTIKKLSAGLHTFTVVAIDKAKNRSVISVGYKFTVKDITAPKAGKVSLKQQSQNNVVISLSKFTDNVKVARYDIYLNGTKVGSTSSSQYTYKGKNLSGSLKFSVKAVDAAGNVSKEKKATVKIKDVTDPTQVKNLNVSQNDKNIILKWDAAKDNVGVTKYDIYVDGKKYSSKTNSLSISRKKLKAGTHNFKVVAWDKAKNDSAFSAVKSFTISSGSSSSGSSSSGGGGKGISKVMPEGEINGFSGTAKNDTITFQKGREFEILADISLGNGADKIIVQAGTGVENEWGDMEYYNEAQIYISDDVKIDMGEGNDTLEVGNYSWLGERGEGNYSSGSKISLGGGDDLIKHFNRGWISAETLDLGSGNDKLQLISHSYVTADTLEFGAGNDILEAQKGDSAIYVSQISFGDGNDEFKIMSKARDCYVTDDDYGYSEILFGNGNDKMTIDGSMDCDVNLMSFGNGDDILAINGDFNLQVDDEFTLDFGAGNDTLKLNGTLQVFADRVFFTGLEKICGGGCIELGQEDIISSNDLAKFKKAGITIKYVECDW